MKSDTKTAAKAALFIIAVVLSLFLMMHLMGALFLLIPGVGEFYAGASGAVAAMVVADLWVGPLLKRLIITSKAGN